MIMDEKKVQERWQAPGEDGIRKVVLVEAKKKAMTELNADETKTIIMDDALARAWRDIRMMEVLERRRQALGSGGDGHDLVSGGATSFAMEILVVLPACLVIVCCLMFLFGVVV
jgi:hypothetical protein